MELRASLGYMRLQNKRKELKIRLGDLRHSLLLHRTQDPTWQLKAIITLVGRIWFDLLASKGTRGAHGTRT